MIQLRIHKMKASTKVEILLRKDLLNLIGANSISESNYYKYHFFLLTKKIVFIYSFIKASLYYLSIRLRC